MKYFRQLSKQTFSYKHDAGTPSGLTSTSSSIVLFFQIKQLEQHLHLQTNAGSLRIKKVNTRMTLLATKHEMDVILVNLIIMIDKIMHQSCMPV